MQRRVKIMIIYILFLIQGLRSIIRWNVNQKTFLNTYVSTITVIIRWNTKNRKTPYKDLNKYIYKINKLGEIWFNLNMGLCIKLTMQVTMHVPRHFQKDCPVLLLLYMKVLNFADGFMALHFTVNSVLPAARHLWILSLYQ